MGPCFALPIAHRHGAWLRTPGQPGSTAAAIALLHCSTCLRPPELFFTLTCCRAHLSPFSLLCRDHPLLPEGAAERGQQGRLLRLPGAGGEGGLLCFCHWVVPGWPPMCTGHLDPYSVLLPPTPSESWPLILALLCAGARGAGPPGPLLLQARRRHGGLDRGKWGGPCAEKPMALGLPGGMLTPNFLPLLVTPKFLPLPAYNSF